MSRYYWAHCHDCGDHFESRSGFCGSCRYDNTKGEDQCADDGCEECQQLQATDEEFVNAVVRTPEERRADLRLVVGGKA